MDKIKVNLKNCYGIKKLEHEFDFKNKNAIILYASNGTMKTSFSNTFKDISNGDVPEDRVTNQKGSCEIKKNNIEIKKEEILVIESYDEKFGYRNISKLLVKDNLRIQYEELTEEIEKEKQNFMAKLKKMGVNKAEEELRVIFKRKFNIEDLKSLKEEELSVLNVKDTNFTYTDLFNDKTMELFKNKDFLKSVTEYIEKYNYLVENSFLFAKGKIDHNNIEDIIKNLKNNNFFSLENTIILSNGISIKDVDNFDKILSEEKERILNNPEIMKEFEKIDKILSKNLQSKQIRKILEENKDFILELNNLEEFKRKIWQLFFKECENELNSLIDSYEKNTEDIEKIIQEAFNENTIWEEILFLYKKRFIVPFDLKIVNKENSLLGIEEPQIEFSHSGVVFEEKKLKEILSQGEKRALYILQILYEIERLKKDNQEKLIIFDDIADSFDYKNKYAIIEYLRDLQNEDKFKMIILTHNFDFYRTVASRLNLNDKTLMTIKNTEGIQLVKGQYTKNLFNVWKARIFEDDKIMIASIPFVRNIIEYCNDEKDPDYLFLTNLLHYKEEDTENVEIKDLILIYNKFWTKNITELNNNDKRADKVLNILFDSLEKILQDANEVLLENKILLSIGSRMKCEKYMLNKIREKNSAYILPTKNQTRELSEIYKNLYPIDSETIKLIEQVNMITPENIHINSFMYEPLLDMSCEHLKNLYLELKKL